MEKVGKGKLTIKYDEGGTEIASLILDTKEPKCMTMGGDGLFLKGEEK